MKKKSKSLFPFLSPRARTSIKVVLDSFVAVAAYGFATILQRGTIYVDFAPLAGEMVVFGLFCAGIFTAMKTYRAIWSYVSLGDIFRLIFACVTAIVIYFGVREMIFESIGLPHIPFSQPIITGMVLLGGLCAFRAVLRILYPFLIKGYDKDKIRKTNILLVGAGDAAEIFIRSIKSNPNSAYEILGILDPRKDRRNRTIHGVQVLGRPKDIERIVHSLAVKPHRVIFTTTDDTKKVPLDILMNKAETLGLKFARLPSLTEFRDGEDIAPQIKPIVIEDLLGRPQTAIDMAMIRDFIKGRRVLITGAGGSIGSELTRQISSCKPESLVIIDNCELNLYTIDLDVKRLYPGVNVLSCVADIRDEARINAIFKKSKPEIVFHAAALKHVPLVEANPSEGILTNVIGTRNVAAAAKSVKATAFVQISTDKAVNPTNIMGASKRIGEYYAQSLDLQKGHTRFVTVRFGNVLGSSGSVVPLFKKQLAYGGPLTVTDPHIERFFMTIKEAVGLVLQASAYTVTDEEAAGARGKILVLDMKEPIKIIDVARQMIRLSDLVPDKDVKIEIIGLRAGEKMYEELFDDNEERLKTAIPSTFAANPKPVPLKTLKQEMDRLQKLAVNNDIKGIITCMTELVPGFTHEAIAKA